MLILGRVILISGKTIFISPLDWGLGHATRCIPVIRELSENNKIIIGTTDLNEEFFNQKFPDLLKVNLPSYAIKYSKKIPLWIKLIAQWPKINAVIKSEKILLEKIIQQHKIDLVISDNRFGLVNKNVKCIFITHQLNLKTPFFSFLANRINLNFIHKFNEVWVPDYEEPTARLSGQLSNSVHLKIPVKYIGPKSALQNLKEIKDAGSKYDYLILLSGIEPQRSILEKLLVEKFMDTQKKVILVRGSSVDFKIPDTKITVVNFAFGEELKEMIVNSETVICRSGYSSLMDLHLLGKKKLILIPTPGQSEQEYLANYWAGKFKSKTVIQGKIEGSQF